MGNLLGRFKIVTKALVPLLLLISVLAGVSALAVTRMGSIAAVFHGLNERDLKAARMMSDTNLALARFGTVGYRLVAETSSEAVDRLDGERKQLTTDIPARVEAIKAVVPDFSQRLDDAMVQFKKGADATEQAMLKAMGSQDQALRIATGEVEPALAAVKKAFDAVQADMDGRVAAAADNVETTVEASVMTTIIAAVVGGILALIITLLILRSGITGPLVRLVRVMETFAKGDYSHSVEGLARRDEIGQMARTVDVFKDNGLAMVAMERDKAEAVRLAESEKRATMNELAAAFEDTVKAVVASVAQTATLLEERSGTMGNVSGDTSQRVLQMTGSSDTAAANMQSVASATEELVSSSGEIGGQVQHASTISMSAVAQAKRASEVVTTLAEKAQRIGEVVDLINGIAAQTNLLALNATIEAARAGEAGKGFAVVATEVKSLASQTGKATEEIASQITTVQAATTEAVAAIAAIAKTIREVNDISGSVAAAVTQQSAATSEIARNIDRAASSAREWRDALVEVSGGASQTGTAAGEISSAARALARQADRLRADVDGFVVRIRAA